MLPIRTKLIVPHLTPDFVPRPRLTSRLDDGLDCRLTLVSAPAGFGKSTLLSSWIESCGRPAAWVSLDPSDDDLTAFFWYLCAAVQSVYPDACSGSVALLEGPSSPPVEVLVATLSNELLELPGEIVVVLDDLQFITDLAVHEALDQVVGHLPPSVHLVIGTRADPALSLASLSAHGQLAEVREQDLTFTTDEVDAFLARSGWGTPEDRLRADRAEGWPAGLRLLMLAVRGGSSPTDEIGHLRGDLYALSYLADEVLRKQPAEMRAFLLRVAIVDRFTAALCLELGAAAPDVSACDSMIERIERERLFITPLGHGWYRFHQLFQRLLVEQTRLTLSGEEITDLHRRASGWYESNGQITEAIRHALDAGDVRLAVHIVGTHRLDAISHERFFEIERWIALFEPAVVSAEPVLEMAKAQVCYFRFELLKAHAAVCNVAMLLDHADLDDETRGTLEGEVAVLQGESAYFIGRYDDARRLARSALDQLPERHSHGRALSCLFQALSERQLGDPEAAHRVLSTALADEGKHGAVYAVRLLTGEFLLAFLGFDLPSMEKSARRIEMLGRQQRLALGSDWSRYFMGRIAYLRGHLEMAMRHFECVAARRYGTHGGLAFYSLLSLALVHQAEGREEEARKLTDDAAAFVGEMGNEFLQPSVDSFRALMALLQGRVAEAADWSAAFDRATPFVPTLQCEYAPLTFAKALIALATPASLSEAATVLTGLESTLRKSGGRVFLIEVLALQARLRDLEGDAEGALAVLAEAVDLAGEGGPVRAFADLGKETGRRIVTLLQEHSRRTGDHEGTRPILKAISPDPSRPQDLVEPLTRRELEVLSLLARDMQNKEIGAQLFISPKTVEGHTLNIYQKLGASGRREAVAHARAIGILSGD